MYSGLAYGVLDVMADMAAAWRMCTCWGMVAANYAGKNYIGHNNIGHNYIGHNYI